LPRHAETRLRLRRRLERYAVAIAATLLTFVGITALRQLLPMPTFLFFIPAVALSAWYGGSGASAVATALSLLVIKYDFLPADGPLRIARMLDRVDVVAFVIVALTITVTMDAMRRARRLAESHAVELERLNEEVTGVAARGTRLLDVVTALSEAPSVDDVTGVVLNKGLAVVEATRAILVRTEGARVTVLGLRGMSPAFAERVREHGRDADLAVMEAVRTGEQIWIGSPEEYRARYPWGSDQLESDDDVHALCAIPLVHAGETVGCLAMSFRQPTAFGVTDRAFTLLLAQATAASLHRAWGYEAERQLRHDAELLARAREEVLGVVAHDLRNPLNLITSATLLIMEEDLPPSRQQEMLRMVIRAARQMNGLISDLLDTVRLQAGRLSLALEDVGVDEVLRQAEETFQPLADERHIQLEVQTSAGTEAVRADPLRLSQIFGNLVGNALKFTPPQGRVQLQTETRGDDVVFLVRDSGPGIPPEHMAHLFDKFWQASQSDRRGAGLGLAIARGLVEAHGGRIWLESAPGTGSTFAFSVPAARSSAHIA
jgi:signal transduction histidine kinase